MKKGLVYGLSAALLLASLTACGTPQADHPSEPIPSAVQTEALPIEPSETVSAPKEEQTAPVETTPQEADRPIESVASVSEESSALAVEESAGPNEVIPATEPPALTKPLPNPVDNATTTVNNNEVSDSPKDDIERYPADPSITIPPGTRYWQSEYVGEIEGYYYSIGLGYFPEGGNITVDPEPHFSSDFWDVVNSRLH